MTNLILGHSAPILNGMDGIMALQEREHAEDA